MNQSPQEWSIKITPVKKPDQSKSKGQSADRLSQKPLKQEPKKQETPKQKSPSSLGSKKTQRSAKTK